MSSAAAKVHPVDKFAQQVLRLWKRPGGGGISAVLSAAIFTLELLPSAKAPLEMIRPGRPAAPGVRSIPCPLFGHHRVCCPGHCPPCVHAPAGL